MLMPTDKNSIPLMKSTVSLKIFDSGRCEMYFYFIICLQEVKK